MHWKHIFTLLALAVPATANAGELEQRGQALLETRCARCHAVGTTGVSPHEKAPAFRHLGRKYKIELLEEALAEGIVTGHPDMPQDVFKPDEIDAVLAYLNSIAER